MFGCFRFFCQIVKSVVLFLGTEKIGPIESAVFVAVIAGSAFAGRLSGPCRARFIAVAVAVAVWKEDHP